MAPSKMMYCFWCIIFSIEPLAHPEIVAGVYLSLYVATVVFIVSLSILTIYMAIRFVQDPLRVFNVSLHVQYSKKTYLIAYYAIQSQSQEEFKAAWRHFLFNKSVCTKSDEQIWKMWHLRSNYRMATSYQLLHQRTAHFAILDPKMARERLALALRL